MEKRRKLPLNYLLLALGFFFLVKGADFFVEGSSNLAKVLKIPTLIIGLTIVAFGTSAPEAAVSIKASLQGSNEITIGNVVGSNICNLLLVLGISALWNPLKTTKKVIRRDYPFCLFAGIILIFQTMDGWIQEHQLSFLSRIEGIFLLLCLITYLYFLIKDTLMEKKKLEIENRKFSWKDILWMVIGMIGILLGGNLVVNSAVEIAKSYQVSESLIALTIVAVGTSLPELVTSAVAARKGETDIAIGNVIGSNIFNIFFILGLSALFTPLTVNFSSLVDIMIMNLIQIFVYLLMLKKLELGKKKALVLLLIYFSYIVYIIGR